MQDGNFYLNGCKIFLKCLFGFLEQKKSHQKRIKMLPILIVTDYNSQL